MMHAQVSEDDHGQLHGIPAVRLALIERVAGTAKTASQRRFLRDYFRGVAEEDLAQRSPKTLAAMALRHHELGKRARKPGETRVSVFNPDPAQDGFDSPHTIVMVVTDDMPFLVDSLNVVFSQAEVAVHFIAHPVLSIPREGKPRAESWQLFEIDRQANAERIAALQAKIASALADNRLAVEDWKLMRERVHGLVAELRDNPPPLSTEEVNEAADLLQWMEAGHFVFLGYRHYRLERGRSEDRLIAQARTSLGILRSARVPSGKNGPTILRGEIRERARDRELLILTKANSTATVHRGTYLDYVGVKTFGERGEVDGEHRFLGL